MFIDAIGAALGVPTDALRMFVALLLGAFVFLGSEE